MNEIEVKVQKYIVDACKFFPVTVASWTELLKDVTKHVKGLVNLSEQLRHVERVNFKDEEDFPEMQQRILSSIYQGIEEEINYVKQIVAQINKVNSDLKNKLTILENTTQTLDWDNDKSPVINGSALQPSLKDLLGKCLDFWLFFTQAAKNINSSFRSIDVRDEKRMCELEKSFKINLEEAAVMNLLAVTQYVVNPKAIV